MSPTINARASSERYAFFGCSWLGFLLLVLALACGCSPPPRTVEVIGRVTLNGEPVPGALVVFISYHKDDAPAFNRTDADGRFRLETYFSAHDIAKGAVPEREYTVYFDKYQSVYKGDAVNLKMAEISAAGRDLKRYIREDAIWDLWPEGVPEDWPLDYLPMLNPPPSTLADEKKMKISKLMRGLPALPDQYLDPKTSGFKVYVERRDEPQTIDFELTGEVEKIKLRQRPDAVARSEGKGGPSLSAAATDQ